jgi:hypothetical protein
MSHLSYTLGEVKEKEKDFSLAHVPMTISMLVFPIHLLKHLYFIRTSFAFSLELLYIDG